MANFEGMKLGISVKYQPPKYTKTAPNLGGFLICLPGTKKMLAFFRLVDLNRHNNPYCENNRNLYQSVKLIVLFVPYNANYFVK